MIPSTSVEIEAELGSLTEVLSARSLTVDATAKVHDAAVSVAGRITSLGSRPGAELEVKLSGAHLSDLGARLAPRLVDVGPFSVASRVMLEERTLNLTDVQAHLGASDLSGNLRLERKGERYHLDLDTHSKLIDLHELIPYRPRSPAPKSPSYVIPEEAFPIGLPRKLDAEAQISISKLRTDIDTELDQIDARVTLRDRKLEADPVTASYLGGQTSLSLSLDAGAEPAQFRLQLKERNMLLGTFVPVVRASGENVGRADVDLNLDGAGNSPREVASNLQGYILVSGKGGAVDSRLLRILVINVGDVLTPFLNRQGNTHLNCIAIGMDFENGVGTARTILVDFPSLTIAGAGTMDLNDESLDLQFRSRSRIASLATLAGPFTMTGSLDSPRVSRVTGATAIAAATIPLRIAGGLLSTVLTGGKSPCEAANAELYSDGALETGAE